MFNFKNLLIYSVVILFKILFFYFFSLVFFFIKYYFFFVSFLVDLSNGSFYFCVETFLKS